MALKDSDVMNIDFGNYGFMNVKVPDYIYDELNNQVKDSPEKLCNQTGSRAISFNNGSNIENLFELSNSKDILEEFVSAVCIEYNSRYNTENRNKFLGYDKFSLEHCWVNYQKKHEFNPIHSHDGTFSFVIFMKIPYLIEDELCNPSVSKSLNPKASTFAFQYCNVFGEIQEQVLPVDRLFEGRMFLFPSNLNHSVYPFYSSDEYRITIAGNIRGI